MSLKGNASGQTLVGKVNRLDALMISAYGIAVKNGFDGTEEEWLESLIGKSAYAYAVDGGYAGSEAAFIEDTANIPQATAQANSAATKATEAAKEAQTAADTVEGFVQTASEAITEIREIVDDGADAPPVVCKSSGVIIPVSDSSDRLLKNMRIFGKTTQNGTPSPTAPIALENVGAGGSVVVQVSGKNLYSRGDKAVTQYATMELPVPLPPGTYTLSALVSSSDIDYAVSRANFMHHNGSSFVAIGSVNMQRDVYNSGTVTIDEPCDAIRFHAGTTVSSSAGDTATWTNIMVEAGAAATEYEPYKGQTITASTPNGLPGIPVSSGGNYTDETGQRWVCDEIDFAKGVYVQRIRQAVFDGSESWSLSSAQKAVSLSLSQKAVSGARGLCSHYVWGGSSSPRIAIYSALNIYDESITTVEAWKERLVADPLTVFYQLAEPVETALSAEELAAYSAIYTHALHTTAINDAIANMELSYVADTKTYIDNKFTELQNAFLATGANV